VQCGEHMINKNHTNKVDEEGEEADDTEEIEEDFEEEWSDKSEKDLDRDLEAMYRELGVPEEYNPLVNYKKIYFSQSKDEMFEYYTPNLNEIDLTVKREWLDDTYIATNKKRHLHINLNEHLQGRGFAAEIIKAFIYREGYRIVPKGRITNPNFLKVLKKIDDSPNFNVDEDEYAYYIDETFPLKSGSSNPLTADDYSQALSGEEHQRSHPDRTCGERGVKGVSGWVGTNEKLR